MNSSLRKAIFVCFFSASLILDASSQDTANTYTKKQLQSFFLSSKNVKDELTKIPAVIDKADSPVDCGYADPTESKQIVELEDILPFIFNYNVKFNQGGTNYGAGADIELDALKSMELFKSARKVCLDADRFDPNRAHCGVIFYMIKEGNTYKLAWCLGNYVKVEPNIFPVKHEVQTFYGSNFHFKIVTTPKDQAQMLFLMNNSLSYTSQTIEDKALTAKEINLFGNNFMTSVNGESQNACVIPVGFFHFDELKYLLGDSITGLRVFYGFHDTEQDKIRLIVFGHDRNGAINTDKVLQRSWPPY